LGNPVDGTDAAAEDQSAQSAKSHSPASPAAAAEEFTLGVGVYPGDPRQNFSPELVIDKLTYRNLALLRLLIIPAATITT